jgi:predicted nucleic acid-binding protein
MIVVSDTAPLNYLILIGRVNLLPQLFGRVVAPISVMEEMCHSAAPEVVRAWASTPPDWLEVRAPTTALGRSRLGAGEADAIALAQELDADLLLIDEQYGKRIAVECHLRVTGTLGVLESAAQKGLLELQSTFNDLRQTIFRFPTTLIAEILKRNPPKKPR